MKHARHDLGYAWFESSTTAVFFQSGMGTLKFSKCLVLIPRADVMYTDEFPASNDWQVIEVEEVEENGRRLYDWVIQELCLHLCTSKSAFFGKAVQLGEQTNMSCSSSDSLRGGFKGLDCMLCPIRTLGQ